MSRYTKPSDRQTERSQNVKFGELADEEALVVIRFIEQKPEIATVNGVTDAIAADLWVLSGKHAGVFEEDRLIFNVGVRNVFDGASRGDLVLGRIEWRKTKGGRNAAVLADPRPGDEDIADKAMAKSDSDEPPF